MSLGSTLVALSPLIPLLILLVLILPPPSQTPSPKSCPASSPVSTPPSPNQDPRTHRVCVYAATSFTGSLVSDYLSHTLQPEDSWCIAGRSESRLKSLEISGPSKPAIMTVPNHGPELEEFLKQTDLVLTLAGPYSKYGKDLITLSATHGTHYVDLSGEPDFQKWALPLDSAAKASGARIVVAGGYDSVPFDLGATLAYTALQSALPVAPSVTTEVRSVVTMVHGWTSGGTLNSAISGTIANVMSMFHDIGKDEEEKEGMMDPYYLVDSDSACTVVDTEATGFGSFPRFDPVFNALSIPHFMAYINSRVIRRSFSLLFPETRVSYSESMTVSSLIEAIIWATPFILKGDIPILPKSGSGPKHPAQVAGGYSVSIKATNPRGSVEVTIDGGGDPGYYHTSKIMTELGLCISGYTPGCAREDRAGVLTSVSASNAGVLAEKIGGVVLSDGRPLLKAVVGEVVKAGDGGEL